MGNRDWQLSGHITRVVAGVNKQGAPYQMVQVGGYSYWLEPEQYDHYQEGEQVVVKGQFIKDVRNASGGFEPVQLVQGIERVNGKPIARVEKVAGGV